MYKRSLFFAILSTLILLSGWSAIGQQIFSKTYGHFDYNYGKDISILGNDYVILANSGLYNSNSTPMLLRIDSVGSIKKFGFLNNENNDIISASKFTFKNNKWYVCGTIQNTTTHDYDCFLSILDTALVLQKTTIYGGSSWDFATSITSSDTTVVVSGNSYSNNLGYPQGTITILNLNGDSLNTFFHDNHSEINDLMVRGDSEIVFTGNYQPQDSLFEYAFVTSIKMNGTLNWEKEFWQDLAKSNASGITAGINNHIVFCGVSQKYDSVTKKDGFVYVLASNGDYIRHEIFNGVSIKDDEFTSITSTEEGFLYATGVTKSFGMGGNDISIFKLTQDAWYLWSTTYGQVNEDIVSKIIYTPSDSGLILCGSSTFFGDFNSNILVVKTTNALTFITDPTHLTSVKNFSELKNLVAYPNPTQNQITIDGLSEIDFEQIEITNLLGKPLSRLKKSEIQNNTLDLSDISSQLLIIKVITRQGIQILKVLKF